MVRLVLLLVLILSVMGVRVDAAVTGVTASPGQLAVNAQGSALARVRWTVEVTSSTPVTLSSPVGTLAGGPVSDAAGRTLRKSVNTLGVSTHRFTERIRISRAAIDALRSGATVTYTRSWDDGGGAVVGIVGLTLGTGGELTIQNAALTFGDDSTYAIVPQGASLRANAVLSTSGRGRLNGVWQVAGPTGRNFVPVGRIRQTLAGPRRTVFESPDLPTDRPGLHLVRLLPDPTASDFTAEAFPVIRYLVQPGGGSASISLRTPAAGAEITPSSRFSWSEVPGAEVYRVEFLASGSVGLGQRVAAIDVAAPAQATGIRGFTLARISREGARYWRVVALDRAGAPLGASSPRRISGGRAAGPSR